MIIILCQLERQNLGPDIAELLFYLTDSTVCVCVSRKAGKGRTDNNYGWNGVNGNHGNPVFDNIPSIPFQLLL